MRSSPGAILDGLLRFQALPAAVSLPAPYQASRLMPLDLIFSRQHLIFISAFAASAIIPVSDGDIMPLKCDVTCAGFRLRALSLPQQQTGTGRPEQH